MIVDTRAAVLCPIDYSEASAGALRYGAAIADHFKSRLVVVTVEDPLLTTALEVQTGWSPEESKGEVAHFVGETLGRNPAPLSLCEYDVAVGKPSVEILRIARERSCDVVVMSSHGLTGARKLFFGSTTERVLRETAIPVLVTPPLDPGPIRIEDAKRVVGRVLVPVDLSSASLHQTHVAAGLAEALGVPLLLVHVIEPVRSHLVSRLNLAGFDINRRAGAEEWLNELVTTLPPGLKHEALIAHGDPAEEAAKVVRDRHAGLVVMGLHGSPLLGPRMGSVTYRMLCLTRTLVLGLPPAEISPPGVPAGFVAHGRVKA